MKKHFLIFLAILSMIASVSAGIEKEVKAVDVQDLAVSLTMDGQWSIDYWLTEEYNSHYYKIVIPTDGYFSFKIMSYISDGCEFELYSGDLSEKYWGGGYLKGCGTGRGTESSPATASRYTSLSEGIYILKISSGKAGRYKLWSSYTNYSVNDADAISYDSPQDFNEGSIITGALTETDSEDWYRISINRTGYYTFFLESYVNYKGGNGATCRLYTSDLLSTIFEKEIYGASESEPKTWKEDIVLNAGTYYVKINASKGLFGDWVAAGKYILKWDSLKQENCEHSYKEERILPTYSDRGYTLHKCEKCGNTYQDSYISKKTLGNVSVYVSAMKKKVRLTWYVVSDASGYQIRYSTDKRLKKSVKEILLKGNRKSKKTIKNLCSKKSYSFQIRAYRSVGSKKIYGKWSSRKRVKVK